MNVTVNGEDAILVEGVTLADVVAARLKTDKGVAARPRRGWRLRH